MNSSNRHSISMLRDHKIASLLCPPECPLRTFPLLKGISTNLLLWYEVHLSQSFKSLLTQQWTVPKRNRETQAEPLKFSPPSARVAFLHKYRPLVVLLKYYKIQTYPKQPKPNPLLVNPYRSFIEFQPVNNLILPKQVLYAGLDDTYKIPMSHVNS